METIFNHGNIRIRQVKIDDIKHVEVMLNCGDYFEFIPTTDARAREAFIALHNSKNI